MLIGKERMQQEIWFQKYHIISLLGSGGTARVYLAKHIKLNSYRAIKCISKTHPLYELQRNEALILKNLKHSCIPIIYDIEEDEEGSYIVEQYLEGETLKDYVSGREPIREDIIIGFAIQLCDLFHYLHSSDRPILYVDLKPDNIMVSGDSLKLIDFGSAIYQDELTREPKYMATRGYAAPELYRQGRLDERCDIYGIGMLLYFMATGTSIPQNAKQISNIDQISGYSKELKNIINHCLRFNPALRYMTVAQLKKHLLVLTPGKGVSQETSRKQMIGIAGTQPRIGVTHLAFRLCHYMKSQRMDCLYKEENRSQCIRRMQGNLKLSKEGKGTFLLEGIPTFPEGLHNEQEMPEACVTIVDFGTLSKDNLGDFLKADIRLLVMGAKEWELDYSEEVLEMVAEYKDIIYLFNFLDGRQFQLVCKNMEQRCCYRIPYEPDPFRKITAQNGLDLFRELIDGKKQRKGKGRLLPL
jgi:serine/threonine-protein kinase